MSEEKTDRSEAAGKVSEVGSPYAWYVLGVLVLVYIFNFIDRGILSILAEDIKADLGIDDSDIGFLYGTAFAVFYAVFGIPLARLADMWTRRSLISIGLFFWSTMTALSGTARSFMSLGVYRVGVGVGESSASPAAFSMLGDYFPSSMRASVMAIYSSGVYIGSGIALFIGGWVLGGWDTMYPDGDFPMGIKGWQAAFMIVGIPGLIMALWVRTLREPLRGQSEGITVEHSEPHPFAKFFEELSGVLPPFTIWSLSKQGASNRVLQTNVAIAVVTALVAWGLIALTGSIAQWVALGIGVYAVGSWIQGLALRDAASFAMVFKSRTVAYGMTGFGWIAFIGYGVGFWLPPFMLRVHLQPEADAGLYLGLAQAIGGFIGVTGGGFFSDWLKRRTPRARPYVGMLSIIISLPVALFMLTTQNVTALYGSAYLFHASQSMWIGSAVALSTELVLPRMRATASAFYILMVTFLGLALGPYIIGQISVALSAGGMTEAEGLRYGMVIALVPNLFALFFLWLSSRHVETDEGSRLERARALGEKV